MTGILGEDLKKFHRKFSNASKPVNIEMATVNANGQIQFEDNNVLPVEAVLIPDYLKSKTIEIPVQNNSEISTLSDTEETQETQTIEVNSGIGVGDNVVLLSLQGGQTFIVLAKVS